MSYESQIPSARPRHWGWISGWGISPADFEAVAKSAWPDDWHTVFAPTKDAVTKVLRLQPDILAGYSLGALLLLAAKRPSPSLPLIGVAPFLAFDAEANLGGTTQKRTRLALRKKFDQQPVPAVNLYLRLAGLRSIKSSSLPYDAADLAWGLEALGEIKAIPENTRSARLFAGDKDPLIKPGIFTSHCDRFEIIGNAGHDYHSLIPQISNIM